MVACLGHGRTDIVEAAAAQAERLAYVYYHHFTNDQQERLARQILEVAAPEMARARFVTGGSEANEMALRLARGYHEERGDSSRWRIISQAQAYHGATLGTLALTGRSSLKHPYEPYLAEHLHIPPSTQALRRDGRGGACRAGPRARGSRAGNDRRLLLRACERRRAARLLAPGCVLEGPRRAAGASTASWSASTRS